MDHLHAPALRVVRRFGSIPLTVVCLTLLSAPRAVWAEEPTAGSAPGTAPETAEAGGELVPPRLIEHPEPLYPAQALADGRAAAVELELSIDEFGAVVGASVLRSGGVAFDRAALDAVRSFRFEPAKQGATAIRSTVQLLIPFDTPAKPGPRVAQAARALSQPPEAVGSVAPLQASTQSTLVLGRRPISAASSFAVSDRDFALRPLASVQDMLRVTPGLVMVQHSGGGKANQYFLRGFDADHGTDLALSIDGIPINMVSHAHGQGFADTNFIIAETVERLEITKGPYFANQGDFATAGAVNLITRSGFEHSSLGFSVGGTPGRGGPAYRGLLIASPKWDAANALFALEIGRQEGPFQNPEHWDKYKLFNKLTVPLSPSSQLTLGEASYSGNWHGSGQLPERAVSSGQVDRFGSLDPSEGGNTARHQLFVAYKLRPNERSELSALAFLGSYRFNLWSNFTLELRDPEHGDEIEQVDRRTFYGGSLAYRVQRELGGVRFDTSIGGNLRSDDIHEQLWHSRERVQLAQLRGNAVHETFVGAYVNEEIVPVHWLRLNLGGRADLLSFAVDNQLVTNDPENPRSGVDSAQQFSPKASLITTPIARKEAELELYFDYGHGFHSNDVRGAFSTPAITPLTRARGEEFGTRTRLWQRFDLAAAAWLLDLDHETTWNGDAGTTGVSPATRRYGLEFESRYELAPWLALDGALTFTRSRFRAAGAENGGGLALAPKQTWSGGISGRHALGAGVARAGLRFYGIGDRPASDDGALVAPGFTQFDLHWGYRQRWFDVAFDLENLFNQAYRSAQFATVSRLRGEPAIAQPTPSGFACGGKARSAPNPSSGASDGRFWGCEDVAFTPAYPFTARVMATIYLD